MHQTLEVLELGRHNIDTLVNTVDASVTDSENAAEKLKT